MTRTSDHSTPSVDAGHSSETASPHAGAEAPVRYAQVTTDNAAAPIGTVQTLDGSATVQHTNGEVATLSTGTPVYLGDLVTAGAHSNLGIVFADKSVFALSDGGSMTLDKFVYDPGATSNSMLFNLIKGTAGFVTGNVVKTGDMEMGTPVAVIAVRGTTVIVQCPLPACTFQAKNGHFDLKIGDKVLTSVGFDAVKVQDGSFSIDLSPKSDEDQQNINTIINTLDRSSSSSNIELNREGVTESHPVQDVTVQLVFDDGTTFNSPLDSFVSIATASNALPAPVVPEPTTSDENVDTATATTTTSDVVPTTTPPINNDPQITSTAQSASVTEIADHAAGENATLQLRAGTVTFTDADQNDTHTASAVAQGSGYLGTFALSPVNDANGSVTWTFAVQDSALDFLKAGEQLTQTYLVNVSDGNGGTATQEVTVTLTGTNDAPVTVADTATTNEDTAVNGTVVDVTTDPDNNPATELTYALVGTAPTGLTFNADGTWSFDPSGNFDSLAQGQTATVTFDYKANDGIANSNTSTVTITIDGVNDAPVTAAETAMTSENTIVNGTVVNATTDADNNPATDLTYAVVGTSPAGLTFNADGTWSFDPSSTFDSLSQGQTATATFNYKANDGIADSNTSTVTITVTGLNDAPAIVANGTVATGSVDAVAEQQSPVNADYPIVGSDLLNGLGGSAGFGENVIPANDDGSSQAIDITSLFGANGLDFFGHNYTQLYVNNNGNVTFGSALSAFTPQTIGTNLGFPIIAAFWADVDTNGGPATATPGGNSTGSDLVYYDLDTTHGVFTATWDDVGFYSQNTSKLDAFQLQVINRGSGDFDIALRYEAINWTTGDASGGVGGLGGSVARAGYSAGDNIPGHTFEIPQSGDQPAMLALPQTQGNDSIQGVYVFHVRNGAVVDSQLTANGVINFSDVDAGDIHTASAAYSGAATALGTLSLVKNVDSSDPGANGLGQFAWTYSVDNNALASLGAGDTKVESFLVSIQDGHGGVVTQTVSVTLNGVNDAPLTAADTATTDENSIVNGTVVDVTTDPDNNPATDLTYALVGTAPAGLTFNADGTWSFDPSGNFDSLAQGQTATVAFDYMANDGIANSNTSTVTITIDGVNDAPVTAADTATTNEDTAVNGTVVDVTTDADNNPATDLTYALVGTAPTGLTFNADGTWSFDPSGNFDSLAPGQTATVTFDYMANDGIADSNTSTVTIIVSGVNDAPVTAADTATTDENSIVNGTVVDVTTDPDNNPATDLTYALVGTAPTGLTFNADGTWSFDPTGNFDGLAAGAQATVTFDYMANDGIAEFEHLDSHHHH